jgi:hypothetical protein
MLMSIIAAMAVPRLNYERYRSDASMRTVRTVLQSAERNAVMWQTNIVVAFDANNRRMEIVEDANNNCAYDTGERLTISTLEEGTRFSLPTAPYPSTSPRSAISGPNLCTLHNLPAIQFLRDGAASSDADIYLTSSRDAPGDYRLIRVTRASGRAESFSYSGTSWIKFS